MKNKWEIVKVEKLLGDDNSFVLWHLFSGFDDRIIEVLEDPIGGISAKYIGKKLNLHFADDQYEDD